MAKLILKQQEPPKGSWLTHYGSQVAYAGFIALLLLISLGILVAFKPSVNATALSSLPIPTLASATDAQAKAQYATDWAKLNDMQSTYEQLAKDSNSYDKSMALLNQAEQAWQHLLIMSESVGNLGLASAEKQQLETEQAYLQDQWQARIHFSELRLERFNTQKQPQDVMQTVNVPVELAPTPVPPAANDATTQATPDVLPSSKYIAQPPAGVVLPAGFCTLNSSGVCKPEANN